MNATEQKIRELAATSQQKAHLEAVRRLQLALVQEMRSAGIKGVDQQLADINARIGFYEDSVGGRFDNALFELTQIQSGA